MSCPICKSSSDDALRPFCSKRCANIDLARWLGGRYVIPSEDGEATADVPEPGAHAQGDMH